MTVAQVKEAETVINPIFSLVHKHFWTHSNVDKIMFAKANSNYNF